MKACKFTFDDEEVFDGFAHGSTWNGFDNVAVTKETLEKIAAQSDAIGDAETAEMFREIEPMENGLYSLGWGFATQIVSDTEASLCDELDAWQKAQGLPPMCAMEQLHEDITPEQRTWLSQFCEHWDAMLAVEAS